jgi:adenosine deaminase
VTYNNLKLNNLYLVRCEMSDCFSEKFVDCLHNSDFSGIKNIPKSDLHNHFVLGGNREFIFRKSGIKIPFLEGNLQSMQEMHNWNNQFIGEHFNSYEMRKLLIEATFYQAKIDGVTVLEIGEDVWGNKEFFHGNVSFLIDTFKSAHEKIAPEIELRLQIGLSRHCPIDYLENCLEPFWGYQDFYSIDLYGDELAQPIQNFTPIYVKAKEHGLKLKAHIGEWGTAEDVLEGIKILGLDEIQHGIAAISSPTVVKYLAENHIRLNICPTSNVKLGRVKSIKEHPIKALYHAGVNVTINSDDVLIFDSDISKEYMRLYKDGTLSAEELDKIRISGLKRL